LNESNRVSRASRPIARIRITATRAKEPVEEFQGYRYHSRDIPISAIRRYARQIAEGFQPDKIILFGSDAYGRPHEWGDVDPLVVMPAYDEINQSIRIMETLDAPFPRDLIVRTPKRLQRDRDDGDWFLHEVSAKGMVLYEKADGVVGAEDRGRPEGGQKTRGRQPPTP